MFLTANYLTTQVRKHKSDLIVIDVQFVRPDYVANLDDQRWQIWMLTYTGNNRAKPHLSTLHAGSFVQFEPMHEELNLSSRVMYEIRWYRLYNIIQPDSSIDVAQFIHQQLLVSCTPKDMLDKKLLSVKNEKILAEAMVNVLVGNIHHPKTTETLFKAAKFLKHLAVEI